MMLYFWKMVYSDFMKKRTMTFYSLQCSNLKCYTKCFMVLHSQRLRKLKSISKCILFFLAWKQKDVTINLHFVVPIFCESNTAMSYSSVLFQRERRGKELLCITLCFSSSIDLQTCIHFKIDRTWNISSKLPSWVPARGAEPQLVCTWQNCCRDLLGRAGELLWGGACPAKPFCNAVACHTRFSFFEYDTGLCAKWFKLVGLYFSLWK